MPNKKVSFLLGNKVLCPVSCNKTNHCNIFTASIIWPTNQRINGLVSEKEIPIISSVNTQKTINKPLLIEGVKFRLVCFRFLFLSE